MSKNRVDILLVESGLVESRSLAQRYVMAGKVRVNGQVILKPSTNVESNAELTIDPGPRFVSRGGEKLAAAISSFELSVKGLICADVGASTGGFTDCLLQNGAERVYAIDVGKGILDWNIRNNPHVIVMEEINARYLHELPEVVDLVAIDVSFISLKLIVPVVINWLRSAQSLQDRKSIEITSSLIALVKPQFEAGRNEVKRGKGVIKDPEVHRNVLSDVLNYVISLGYGVNGFIRSPLKGPKGNLEYLAYLIYPGRSCPPIDLIINQVIDQSEDGSEIQGELT